jgi:hypothetical protein
MHFVLHQRTIFVESLHILLDVNKAVLILSLLHVGYQGLVSCNLMSEPDSLPSRLDCFTSYEKLSPLYQMFMKTARANRPSDDNYPKFD